MRTAVLVLALLFCGWASARAQETQSLQLKDQMRGLMDAFRRLETHLDAKPPRYEEMIRVLDEMSARAETVESLKIENHPAKDMKRLIADIEGMKREASRKSASGSEDGMNRLSENCFRCHLSHKEPPAKGSL
jgi:DNA anti-recombination protein RmuC